MTRFQTLSAWLTAVFLLVFASSSLALDLGGHDRDGTVVGLTIGHGWNSIEFTGPNGTAFDTGDISSFTGGFRVGWASNDHFIINLGLYGWSKGFYSPNYLSSSAKTYHFMLEGYWFVLGEGFWVKGGIGRGTLDFYGKAPLPKDDLIFNEKGWTMSTGAGYEFRISDGAALGISYDLLYLPIGDYGTVTDVKSISHNLSLNIHFYIM